MKKIWIIVLVFLFAWLIVFGAVYTAFYFGLRIERLDALTNFGKTVDGVVAAKQPEQHRTIIYYYDVDGIHYTGIGSGGNGNLDFDDLQIGDKVIVKYDELYPLDSYMGLPQYKAQADRGLAYTASFIISLVLVGKALGIYLIVRQIRRSRSTSTIRPVA